MKKTNIKRKNTRPTKAKLIEAAHWKTAESACFSLSIFLLEHLLNLCVLVSSGKKDTQTPTGGGREMPNCQKIKKDKENYPNIQGKKNPNKPTKNSQAPRKKHHRSNVKFYQKNKMQSAAASGTLILRLVLSEARSLCASVLHTHCWGSTPRKTNGAFLLRKVVLINPQREQRWGFSPAIREDAESESHL